MFLHFAKAILLFRENRKLSHFCIHCSRVFTNFSSRSDHVVDHSREQKKHVRSWCFGAKMLTLLIHVSSDYPTLSRPN